MELNEQAVRERVAALGARLRAARRADDLMSSNVDGDVRPSITVSSFALQALVELGDPTADLVYRAIVEARHPPPYEGAAGPWLAQGGGPSHSIATSTAIFGSIRHRLDALRDVADAVEWLVGLQDVETGGWPYCAGRPSRPFHTAQVLNSLLQYSEKAHLAPDVAGELLPRTEQAIGRGVRYLTDNGLCPAPNGVWLWDQQPGSSRWCIATTGLSLHVLLKASRREGFQWLVAPTCQSLAELARGFRPNILDRTQIMLEISGVPAAPTWPSVTENEPSYWYAYFTPLLALTFSDATKHDPQHRVAYEAAIFECVRWVLEEYEPDALRPNAKGVWAIAQAILVLKRSLIALAPASASSSSLVKQLLDAGPDVLLRDRSELGLLAQSAGGSVPGRLTAPATAEQSWAELVREAARDTISLLHLMEAIVSRHPGSKAASVVRDALGR